MKRKFSLFLNIATLVLCVCAIAFGVYSAKTASLNVGGQIGFVAHDCKVQFEGEVEGAVLSNATDIVKSTAPKLYIQSGNNAPGTSAPSTPITIDGGASTATSLSFGNLKFALDNDHEPYPIKFTFKVTNLSAFDVCASLNLTEFNVDPSITYTANEYKLKLGTDDATKSNTFTITLTAGSASITNSPTSKINLTFEKFNVPTATDMGFTVTDYEYGEDGDKCIMAVPAKTDSTTLTIPAYFSDASDNLIRVKYLSNGEDATLEDLDGYTNIVISEGICGIQSMAFCGITSISQVTIPSSVTYISIDVFWGCTNYANVKISANLQSIGAGAFNGTAYETNATAETTPSYVDGNIIYLTDKLDGTGTKLVAYKALDTSITSATIANTTKVIAGSAFEDCTSLTSITIPSSVKSIGDYAFYECTGLNTITLSSGATSIGYDAFSGCTGLTGTLIIPSSVTSIGGSAFMNCTGLNSLEFAETKIWQYGNYDFSTIGGDVTFNANTDCKDYFIATSGTYYGKYWRVKP